MTRGRPRIKPVFGGSDQVRHKTGCTATEDCSRLETPDLEIGGFVLRENKGFDCHIKANSACDSHIEHVEYFVKII